MNELADLLPPVLLLSFAVLSFAVAPHLLGRGTWRVHRPQLCLTGWCALFCSGLLAAAAAIIWIIVDGISARLVYDQQAWLGPTASQLSAWIALGVAGAALSLIGTKAMAMVVTERQLRTTFNRLIARASTRQALIGGLHVHIIDDRIPVACSLRRTGGQIMLSSTVVAALDQSQLQALIAHEQVHLRQGHDLMLRLAALNADCLPGFLTPVSMQRSTRLLIELIADRSAAQKAGTTAMVTTLRRLHDLSPAETLLLRSQLIQAHSSGPV